MRQIGANQTTIAQRESFERLTEQTNGLVNALDILGPESEEVKNALSALIFQADNLSSENIEVLIERMKRQAEQANLSAKEQETFNATIAKLEELLGETKIEEQQKAFQDFFGVFTAAGTAVSTLGLFVLQLQKLATVQAAIAKVVPVVKGAGSGVGKGAPGAGASAALGLLAIPGILEAAGFEKNTTSPITGGAIKVVNPFETLDKLSSEEGRRSLNINFNNPIFNSNMDLEETMTIAEARLKEIAGQGLLG